MASDPLVPKTLERLRKTDPAAARRAEHALSELLSEGGLADLTQHELQAYLWYTLAEADEPHRTAAALGTFLELAEMDRYASIAVSQLTVDILRIYEERGQTAGARAAAKAMEASGILPPGLPELEWGEIMGGDELDAYVRIAASLELAVAAGELKPGARGWRVTQARLTRHQLTMQRPDGPPLLERVRAERFEAWVDTGGNSRRALAASIAPDLAAEPAAPGDVIERMAPMQWLLEVAAGRGTDGPGIALTVGGNMARKIVQESAERFAWWEIPDRAPRGESDIWQLSELRLELQRAGMLRRVGRKLTLGTRGRALLGDPLAQWMAAVEQLVEHGEFEGAAQEAALMLLLQAHGMVDVDALIHEVADVLAGSGWRDTGSGAPPDERDVSRAVWGLVRRCQLWSLLEEGRGPGFSTRLRLSEVGTRAGFTALRASALRARMDPY